MTCGIYCIENIINNKKYIGFSKNIEERWRKHREALLRNKHVNTYLQNAWNKYGESKFIFYVIEDCKKNELEEKEIYYIDILKTKSPDGFNLTGGGEGAKERIWTDEERETQSKKYAGKNNPFYGKKHSKKTRKKISESHEGTKLSEETKKKISENSSHLKGEKHPLYGKKLSKKRKLEISKQTSGENNPMYGKHHSLEAKEKMSNVAKGNEHLVGKKYENSSSKYHGVCYVKNQGVFYSQIGIGGKNLVLGGYKDEKIAARAYDFYIIKNNLNRSLNFPLSKNKTLKLFENKRKGKIYKSKSKYFGVSYHKKLNKWQVGTRVQGKRKYIGIYETEIDAAKAYDKFIIENNLDKPLNFPEDYE